MSRWQKVKDRFYEIVYGVFVCVCARACVCNIYRLKTTKNLNINRKHDTIEVSECEYVCVCLCVCAMRYVYEYGFLIIMGWECGSQRFITNKNVIIIKLGLEKPNARSMHTTHTHCVAFSPIAKPKTNRIKTKKMNQIWWYFSRYRHRLRLHFQLYFF